MSNSFTLHETAAEQEGPQTPLCVFLSPSVLLKSPQCEHVWEASRESMHAKNKQRIQQIAPSSNSRLWGSWMKERNKLPLAQGHFRRRWCAAVFIRGSWGLNSGQSMLWSSWTKARRPWVLIFLFLHNLLLIYFEHLLFAFLPCRAHLTKTVSN